MAFDRDHILHLLEEKRDDIRRLGVKELSLFGSCAKDRNTTTSDLDFLVEFESKSFDAYMDLKMFLEDIFNRKVDLVLTDALKPRLRDRILKECIHAPGL